ncbi:MAG: FHA domain-containing protein [Saprospiraceae bacterium]|nr:FHA domain-containing protein [Saprospiraceae bacterium]
MVIKVGHASNPANHVRINDNSVSRDHLEVEMIDDDTLRIKDLGSTNGTSIGT